MHPLLKRAKLEGTPLIDGTTVTFLWRGKTAPKLIGDFNDWGQGHPKPKLDLVDKNLWACALDVASNAYLEYVFRLEDENLPDPLNPRRVSNTYGKYNSYFYMPEAEPNPLIKLEPGMPKDLTTRHKVKTAVFAVGPERTVLLYQPAVMRPCPLMVVYDGLEYARFGKLVNIVDNLIAQKRIRPVALALVANHRKARGMEYGCNDLFVRFIDYIVLPLAQLHLNLISLNEHPGSYGIMGASMGGVMALYTALRLPHVFGQVLSQSGAFTFNMDELVVWDILRYHPRQPLKVWLDVGQYDLPELIPTNHMMYDLLKAQNYPAEFRQYTGGHNYTAWRNDLWRGLEWLYPPEADELDLD